MHNIYNVTKFMHNNVYNNKNYMWQSLYVAKDRQNA
jgi:hypothetical protein